MTGSARDQHLGPSADGRSTDTAALVLDIKGLSKRFGSTQALDGATLQVKRGEVHALFGENGSGKSTLIKSLVGVQQADSGEIIAGDVALPAKKWTTEAAHSAGLRFAHQDFALFPTLSVAENLFADAKLPTGLGGRVLWTQVRERSSEWLRDYGLRMDPRTPVGQLRPADQALVSILRAMRNDFGRPNVLFLDEPTAALPEHEVGLLFDTLGQFVAAGTSIVYVTHRYGEITKIADRITVLRDGRSVATLHTAETSKDEVATLISPTRQTTPHAAAAPSVDSSTTLLVDGSVLIAENLSAGPLKGISFQIHRGEVVGVCGLLGSGRTSLLLALYGLLPLESGTLIWQEERWAPRSPREAMAADIGFLPETRRQFGFFDDSIKANLLAGDLGRFWRRGHFSGQKETAAARSAVDAYSIKCKSVDDSLSSLSGGNQQKVLLARCLMRTPSLLLLDEPTQGVDIGARAEIWRLLAAETKRGMSVLVATSDPEELLEQTDRLLVLSRGSLVADLPTSETTNEQLTALTWSSKEIAVR